MRTPPSEPERNARHSAASQQPAPSLAEPHAAEPSSHSPAVLLIAATLVFLLAALLRLPACYESLWVDELHSAWVVWGGLAEVAQRAEAGNQAPWYFYALWVWKQMLGGSELALRLPSLIATAAACALLVIAAARASSDLATGVLAGTLLAVERNAIFFGTEVRPFAVVLLLTTVAAVAAERLYRSGSNAARSTLAAAAFLAVLIHPTAGLPLAAIAAVAMAGSLLGRRPRWPPAGQGRADASPQPPSPAAMAAGWRWGDVLLAAAMMALALAINAASVGKVWRQRANWSSFAQPQSLVDLVTLWPWWWLVVVPLVLWGLLRTASRLACGDARPGKATVAAPTAERSAGLRQQWPMLLAAVVLTTAVSWGLSRSELLSIWHRRYMVGSLPLLCWASADLWRGVAVAGAACLPQPNWRRGAVVLCAVIAVLTIAWSQGTLGRLTKGQFQLTTRGEHWRGAVRWVRQQRRSGEPLWVAAELIESVAWTGAERAAGEQPGADGRAGVDEPLRRYLVYPVSGPYRLEDPRPMGPAASEFRSVRFAYQMSETASRSGSRTSWMIVRLPAGWLRPLLTSSWIGTPPPAGTERPRLSEVRSFGGVTVLRLEHK